MSTARIFNNFAPLLFSFVFALSLTACQSEQDAETPDLLTQEYYDVDTTGKAVNPENSEYVFSERDITKTEAVRTKLKNKVQEDLQPGVPPMIEPVFPKFWEQEQLAIRILSNADEFPVFSTFCRSSTQPKACSDRAYREYIDRKKSEMKEPLHEDETTVQWLRFTVTEEGLVENVVLFNTWGVPCTECAEKAKSWIENMPAWNPARQQGKAVNARMEAPVVF